MATIGDITQGSYYDGRAALGDGYGVSIKIDNTPINTLAEYTYNKDRMLWAQKQVDDANAAKQIADISSYNPNSPLEKQTGALKEKLARIQDILKRNPRALYYGQDGYDELRILRGEFENERKQATVNDLIYNSRLSAIQAEPDQDKKRLMQDELEFDKENFFKESDFWKGNNFLSSAPISALDYQIPDVDVTTSSEIIRGSNTDYKVDTKFINPNTLLSKAQIAVMGMSNEKIDVNSPAFKNLSEKEKKLALSRQQYKMGRVIATQRMSQNISSIYGQIKSQYPDFVLNSDNVNALPIDGTAKSILLSIAGYNEDVGRLNSLLPNSKSNDPTQRNIKGNFSPINIEDGVSPAELIALRTWQKEGGFIKGQEKMEYQTNNLIDAQRLAEERRNNDLNRQERRYEFDNTPRSGGSASASSGGSGADSDSIDNPALLFKEHLSNINNFFSRNQGSDGLWVMNRSIDPKTRFALGIKNDSKGNVPDGAVKFKKNGDFEIYEGGRINDSGGYEGGKYIRNNTLDNLAQGFIDAVKTTDIDPVKDKDGTMNAKFQKQAEDGFAKIYGTKDYRQIYNNFVVGNQGAGSGQTNSRKTYEILDNNGNVVLSGQSEDAAKKAQAKGYKIR